MKKFLAIAIVLMMVPFSAFSMEMISDADMDDVTGQAGVTIALDNITIYQRIDGLSYTDTDGAAYVGAANAGTIGIDQIEQTITLKAIGGSVDPSTYGITAADCRPLTIDVAAGTAIGTAIIIGLPTLEITVSEFSFNPYLSDGTTDVSFGTVTVGQQTIAILGGVVEIAAH